MSETSTPDSVSAQDHVGSVEQQGEQSFVPKKLHQFWDKPVVPPDIAVRMDSWRECHPDWEYFRWNDQTATDLILKEFGRGDAIRFLSAKLPAMRADIARVAIGLVHGGLYVEANWACGRRLDDFLVGHGTLRHKVAAPRDNPEKQTKIGLSNGFFAIEPRSVLFEKVWRQIMDNIESGPFFLHVSRISGPLMFTKVWRKRLSEQERSRYALISEQDLLRYLVRPGRAEYRQGGAHWIDEINQRRIIDRDLGKKELKRLMGDRQQP